MTILIIYIVIFTAAFFVVRMGVSKFRQMQDFTSLKTVTFGDESAVRPDRWASVISVITIFLLWGAFTGSKVGANPCARTLRGRDPVHLHA